MADNGWNEIAHDPPPPAGKLVLGLRTAPQAIGKHAWVIARWDAGSMQWLIVERNTRPDALPGKEGWQKLKVPAGEISWWRDLPTPPDDVEIIDL